MAEERKEGQEQEKPVDRSSEVLSAIFSGKVFKSDED